MEVYLKGTEIFGEAIDGPWVFNDDLQIVVAIDFFLDQILEASINLVSFNRFDIICMDRIWNLISLLQNSIHG